MKTITITEEQRASLDMYGHGSVGFHQGEDGETVVVGDEIKAQCGNKNRKLYVRAISCFPSRINPPPAPFNGCYVIALVENVV